MKVLVVLSHLMTKDGILEVESEARAKLAIDKFSSTEYDYLITIGWAYRDDCIKAIADVVKQYILEKSFIEESSIIALTQSRDTVGDAFYCLDWLYNTKITELHIVTSDYHVNRTNIIFNSIFNNTIPIQVFGVSTDLSMESSIAQHEHQSLEAFYQTFMGVDFSFKNQIFEAIAEKHPFYNGKIHRKISSI
ncbi:YdcF family protein [Amylibacter sp.]|nr:YdcF family protein [Amylibacter sp.]